MQIYIYTGKYTQNTFLQLMDELEKEQMMRTLVCIHSVRDNYQGNPTPPLAKPLTWEENIGLNEFRISFKDFLVRIHYFVEREQGKIIILNYYTKANGARDKNAYNKKEQKKLQKYIGEQIQIAQELHRKYYINPDEYEFYN